MVYWLLFSVHSHTHHSTYVLNQVHDLPMCDAEPTVNALLNTCLQSNGEPCSHTHCDLRAQGCSKFRFQYTLRWIGDEETMWIVE